MTSAPYSPSTTPIQLITYRNGEFKEPPNAPFGSDVALRITVPYPLLSRITGRPTVFGVEVLQALASIDQMATWFDSDDRHTLWIQGDTELIHRRESDGCYDIPALVRTRLEAKINRKRGPLMRLVRKLGL